MSNLIEKLSETLGEALFNRQLKLATAESCTAGGLSYAITSVPGSSKWFDRGFVTYSNFAKIDMLDVKRLTIEVFGAVSELTAREMSEGVLQRSAADISISITGIAGPEGGSADKPVGTVWMALSGKDKPTITYVDILAGDRKEIREQSIQLALEKLIKFINDNYPL